MQQLRAHAGLRGIAALLVVTYHLQFGARHTDFEDATYFFKQSFLMVDLFFVLSGFIIGYANDGARTLPMRAKEVYTFLMKRVIRLYPLHIFCLLAMVALYGAQSLALVALHRPPSDRWSSDSLEILGIQFLLLNAWIPRAPGWNIPTWSISAEMFAYAVFPLLVLISSRSRRMAVAAMLGIAFVYYAWVALTGGSLNVTTEGSAPARCISGFMIGYVLYLLSTEYRFSDLAVNTIQVSCVIIIFTFLMIKAPDVALIPCFAVLVSSLCTDRGIIGWSLGSKPLQFLGDISYSIYLVHIPIIKALAFVRTNVLTKTGLDYDWQRLMWIFTCLGITLAVSKLTYAYVEKPWRQRLTRLILHRRAGPIAASPEAP